MLGGHRGLRRRAWRGHRFVRATPSRTRRRTRFLITAFPIFLVKMIPNFIFGIISRSARTPRTRYFPENVFPSLRTRKKSLRDFMRIGRFNRIISNVYTRLSTLQSHNQARINNLGLPMALVMQFCPLRNEPLTPFLTAPFDNAPTTFSLHPCTESVLTLAAAL